MFHGSPPPGWSYFTFTMHLHLLRIRGGALGKEPLVHGHVQLHFVNWLSQVRFRRLGSLSLRPSRRDPIDSKSEIKQAGRNKCWVHRPFF